MIKENSSWETDSKAKLEAQKISFGAFIFKAAKAARDTGLLKSVEEAKDKGITLQELVKKLNMTSYSIKTLLDASESTGIINKKGCKYTLTKTGDFILNDAITRINMDFANDVCYNGMFYLAQSLRENIPAGLKVFGDWNTIYEALSSLPEKAKESWFNFDHYFSDKVFAKALNAVMKKNPKKILDVGGNTGKWAIKCVSSTENVSVTIMDLPQQITTAKEIISKLEFKDRISYHPVNLLENKNNFPIGHDAIWMSQFLDCFSIEQIISILKSASDVMDKDTNLFILETFIDRQKYEAAKFCLDMTSLYFTAMANGKSKMYEAGELQRCVNEAGLEVVEDIPIGISHTLFICRKK